MADDFAQEQSQMADSFFADSQGLVEDSGTQSGDDSEAQSESITDSPKSKTNEAKTVEAKGNQQTTQNAKTNAGTQADDRGSKDGGDEPLIDKNGAQALLFKEGEDGQLVFDAEKALGLFKPEPQSRGGEFQVRQQQQAQQGGQQQKDNRPPWEIRAEEMQKREKTLVGTYTTYKQFMLEALNAGYEGHQALHYAESRVMEKVRQEMERARYEEDAKRDTEREESVRKREEMAQARERYKTVYSALDKQFNGNLDKLLIGYSDASGKFYPGEASADINTLFDLMNPGAFNGQDNAALKSAYTEWWTRMMSNEKTAKWIADIGRLRLMQKSLPHILKAQRGISSAQAANLSEGKSRAPGKNQKQQSSSGKDKFDSWLESAPGEKVDFIGA
jgi:hypothetical protein